MNLNVLAQEAYQTAVDHGWWDKECSFGESLALVHSEVSEVLEDWRRGYSMSTIQYEVLHDQSPKPTGIPIEFADIIIRVLNLCAAHKIDIDSAVREKMAYNKGRSYRHGNLLA